MQNNNNNYDNNVHTNREVLSIPGAISVTTVGLKLQYIKFLAPPLNHSIANDEDYDALATSIVQGPGVWVAEATRPEIQTHGTQVIRKVMSNKDEVHTVNLDWRQVYDRFCGDMRLIGAYPFSNFKWSVLEHDTKNDTMYVRLQYTIDISKHGEYIQADYRLYFARFV